MYMRVVLNFGSMVDVKQRLASAIAPSCVA